MKRLFSLCFLVTYTLFSWVASGQSDFDKVEIQTTKLTQNIHMLTGMGGNLGVISGPDGVFLIDDQFAPLSDKIRAAIKKISDQPIRFVLNTHWHFDHTGGNENLGKLGSIIVAHQNVRKRLSVDNFIKAFGREVPVQPKEGLPIITFSEQVSFHLNGEDIEVVHVQDAHTDGDSVIFFKAANVIHTGDVFFNKTYPFIDTQHGGSLAGTLSAIDMILKRSNKHTKIIPGHGPLATIKDLKAYKKMLLDVQETLTKMKEQGKTLEQVQAAKPTAKYDEVWGKGWLSPEKFVEIVYSSLN